MWRKAFTLVGEFIRGDFFTKALLAVFGTSSGVTVIVNIYVGVVDSPKTPREIAVDAFVLSCWLLFFLIVTYLICRGLGTVLIWSANYYPAWFYFPKLDISTKITPENEVEVTIINRKMQRISLWAGYAVLRSHVKSLPPQADGVAPDDNKQLLPLAAMTGKDARVVRIGKIENGSIVLSAGRSNGEMKLEKPGTYLYYIKLAGKFRDRIYSGGGPVTIRITEDKEIRIED